MVMGEREGKTNLLNSWQGEETKTLEFLRYAFSCDSRLSLSLVYV